MEGTCYKTLKAICYEPVTEHFLVYKERKLATECRATLDYFVYMCQNLLRKTRKTIGIFVIQ